MQGRLYIKTTQILPFFFLLYSSIAILLFHTYPTILSRFFTLVEKILRSADRRLFVLYIFLIYVCIKGHSSSDSGPS